VVTHGHSYSLNRLRSLLKSKHDTFETRADIPSIVSRQSVGEADSALTKSEENANIDSDNEEKGGERRKAILKENLNHTLTLGRRLKSASPVRKGAAGDTSNLL